jgi:SAM-dependent methyltransferase
MRLCHGDGMTVFDDLLAEAGAQPTEGWDFSWFDGRATEERPSWGYARLISERMASASSALDVETGGGEVLAGIQSPPPRLVATESWLPNVEVARNNLRDLGARVVAVADDALPFSSNSFDLIVSRHPVTTPWEEVARVLIPGGTYLSQQVGAGSNRELTDFFMGPQPVGNARDPERHVAQARAAGLRLDDLRDETLLVEFFDVGAVAYFLKKVLWTVPGFSIDTYRDRLQSMHEQIERDGRFIAHSRRFLIQASKPA